jgi:hypothetical protein
VRKAISTLLLLTTLACSSTQQEVVGGGITALGLATTYVAVQSMAGCSEPTQLGQACDPAKLTAPSSGVPVALGGVGVALLGGVIMATARRSTAPRASSVPAPVSPDEPLPALGETEAVGMVLARLVLSGVEGMPRPTRLVAVDSAHISFQVEDGHAELWNLRVQAAADGAWVTLGACYDYDDEHGWVVTSLGRSPGCAWSAPSRQRRWLQ